MGRVKLKIKKLQNINGRQTTFAKRKHGIIKKAMELSILCDIDIVLLMFSPTGKPSLCIGKHSIGEVIAKYAKLPYQERTKRKLENLEALKKTFMKTDHDVDISEFLDGSRQTVEDLSEKVTFLQTHLSEIHTRLSYWTELENTDSVDALQHLENSLRQSLAQMRAHKESMAQHQQQQLMSSECNNQMQTEIDIDFGMEMEQQLENFSWVHSDENMNVPIKEEDPTNLQLHQMYRDITYSASSSLGSYTGLFGNSSDISNPDLDTKPAIQLRYSGIPKSSADPNLQISNLSFLNDQKLQQLAEWNLLGSPADYYVSQILEASCSPQFGGNNWASSETLPNPVTVIDDPLFSRPN